MDIQTIKRLFDKSTIFGLEYNPLVAAALSEAGDTVSARLGYYRFLHHLIEELRPEFCIELGVESGVASAYMISAANDAGLDIPIIGVDLNYHSTPGDLIPKYYTNYHFIVRDTISAVMYMPDLVGQRKLGLIFQDSSHHYEKSVQEWDYYIPFLGPGSVWVCDDIVPAFRDPAIDPPGKGMVEYFNSRPGEKYIHPYANGGNATGVILI